MCHTHSRFIRTKGDSFISFEKYHDTKVEITKIVIYISHINLKLHLRKSRNKLLKAGFLHVVQEMNPYQS